MQYFWEYLLHYLRMSGEIFIIAMFIYYALLFMKGTRSSMVLAGVTSLMFGLTFVSQLAGFAVIEWLLSKIWAIVATFLLIIFQPEIRRALAELGSQQKLKLMRVYEEKEKQMIDCITSAAFFLSANRFGALIVLEKDIGMRSIAETGVMLDAPLRAPELVETIFYPKTPLHDGGMIIKDGRIVAAGCILPITDSKEVSRGIGTRHRAAIGITEETDAMAVVVSEETGIVSIAYRGRLLRGLDENRLARHLRAHLRRKSDIASELRKTEQ